MKLYDKVAGRIPEMLGIPDQTLPGIPIIEIYGNERVLIEGQCRVVQYGCSVIKLRNACGFVCVCGCGLSVAELSQSKMIITGNIQSISMSKG